MKMKNLPHASGFGDFVKENIEKEEEEGMKRKKG